MDDRIRAIQTALRDMNHDPGPVDGLWGRQTRDALERLLASGGKAAAPRGGLTRIIWHWTAGTHAVSALDRAHYHWIIAGDGTVATGDHAPEANISTGDGDYAAHTLNANTGAIGVAVAAMAGARERPFDPGAWPIRPVQIDALVAVTAQLCRRYGIPVGRATTLSHAEVQPTLGIAQRGKWDIAWLPGMAGPADPVAVGDILRARVTDFLNKGA